MSTTTTEQSTVSKSDDVNTTTIASAENDATNSVLNQTAHILGNYHKYYTFHSAKCRVELLQGRQFFRALWEAQSSPSTFCFLDIGCNEGDLTLELYEAIKNELPSSVQVRLYGIDIDPVLIELANSKVREQDKEFMTFRTVNAADKAQITQFRDSIAPYKMSLVTVFSTTMWIHINHGDDGLQLFLQEAYQFCLPTTGVMLIEPQPGRCYTNAAKRLRKLGLDKPPFLHCVDKTKVHETITKMMQHESIHMKNVYCFGEEDWGRALLLFHNLGESFLKVASQTPATENVL